MQIIGAKFAEQTILGAASVYEQLSGGFACVPQIL
jgi:Asp-tRNA(Asn)/Glu-tRNA(Gln) amidotransferase A subunit family amidase